MNAPHVPKVAGISSALPAPGHNSPPKMLPHTPNSVEDSPVPVASDIPPLDRPASVHDHLAGLVSDLTSLHELTERLVRTDTLDTALHELLAAGATLVGAQRGLIVLHRDGRGPETTVGLGLGRADLGTIETIPRGSASYGRILDGLPETDDGQTVTEVAHPDLLNEPDLDPRHREVAARLGYAASYAVPLATDSAGRFGAAVWLYDEPTEPVEQRRRLVGQYTRYASEHLARHLELAQARTTADVLREELLPSRLPRLPGVQLAVRHSTGPRGGGDWYDALPLPEGALGLAVGGAGGEGPGAVAAMGRLRASLRAYAVMEGEDPVAVLSDLELLLRLTEPARTATALFAYCEPAANAPGPDGPHHHSDGAAGTRITLAGAGHCPPLLLGEHRTEYVETTLSAPLGMLACWEAPSVEITAAPGETLLLYSDGLLHRTGGSMDRAFARLHAAAAGVPKALRGDPDAIADHVLRTMLPDWPGPGDSPEDVVLLAARFAGSG